MNSKSTVNKMKNKFQQEYLLRKIIISFQYYLEVNIIHIDSVCLWPFWPFKMVKMVILPNTHFHSNIFKMSIQLQ